jgi:hypothetical protein
MLWDLSQTTLEGPEEHNSLYESSQLGRKLENRLTLSTRRCRTYCARNNQGVIPTKDSSLDEQSDEQHTERVDQAENRSNP